MGLFTSQIMVTGSVHGVPDTVIRVEQGLLGELLSSFKKAREVGEIQKAGHRQGRTVLELKQCE